MRSGRVTGVVPEPGIPSRTVNGVKRKPKDLTAIGWEKATGPLKREDPWEMADRIEGPAMAAIVARAERRIMALDLSTRKVGLAWGQAGEKPEGTCLITPAKTDEEGRRLAWLADTIAGAVEQHRCRFVIFSEFYSGKNMMALRANASLRGAVMARLSKDGIEALPVAEITARKAAGVDIRKRQQGEPAKGYMKARAAARLQELGLGHLQEDEGDAAILLLGATAVVEIGTPKETNDAQENTDSDQPQPAAPGRPDRQPQA